MKNSAIRKSYSGFGVGGGSGVAVGGGTGVNVGVALGGGVLVGTGVLVGSGVWVEVGVWVGVGVWVEVAVGVGVSVGVDVGVNVGKRVDVGVGVASLRASTMVETRLSSRPAAGVAVDRRRSTGVKLAYSTPSKTCKGKSSVAVRVGVRTWSGMVTARGSSPAATVNGVDDDVNDDNVAVVVIG